MEANKPRFGLGLEKATKNILHHCLQLFQVVALDVNGKTQRPRGVTSSAGGLPEPASCPPRTRAGPDPTAQAHPLQPFERLYGAVYIPVQISLEWAIIRPAEETPAAQGTSMRSLKILVEHYEDGYVAYPVALKGIVVGEGDSVEAALACVRSAIQFHLESFGGEALTELPQEVVLAEVEVAV